MSIRVMISSKFPTKVGDDICPIEHQKVLFMSLLNNIIRAERYLPDPVTIQNVVCSIYECDRSSCTRKITCFVYVNEEIQTNTLLRTSQYRPPDAKKLDKKERDKFDKLKRIKTKRTCSICLKDGFVGVQMKCGCIFHKNCIKKAFKYEKKCPNCKIGHIFTV